jgi:hypothetical protein
MGRVFYPGRLAAERQYPHRIDVPVPGTCMGDRLARMMESCRQNVSTVGLWDSHGVRDWRHRDENGFPRDLARFYFMDEVDAEAFRRAWLLECPPA